MKHNEWMEKLASGAVAAAIALSLVLAPAAAEARSQSGQASSDFGIGVVTVFANVGYMPVKVVYGVLGGLTGCFAYVFSGFNREVADGVWVPSLGGDYVLTTDMMTGREPVHFNGIRGRSRTTISAEPPADDESSGF